MVPVNTAGSVRSIFFVTSGAVARRRISCVLSSAAVVIEAVFGSADFAALSLVDPVVNTTPQVSVVPSPCIVIGKTAPLDVVLEIALGMVTRRSIRCAIAN